jgi:hypothetical protein
LQDGRSEVAFAMSCDDRLSAGTNGVRAALPTDLPAEFLRPPSPERVFEDGPDACLLGDEDERLSFVDDAMSFTSELANGTEAMPGGWRDAFKVLRVKTKRFSFAVDDDEEEEEEDEDPFAQFTLATKDCQTCLGDYRRECRADWTHSSRAVQPKTFPWCWSASRSIRAGAAARTGWTS